MLMLFAFLFGSVVGSFLNVCIHRLPKEESIVFPRSRCPACQAPIRAVDNIPLLSFALLRGRCHACGQPISWQYPLVEGLTGLLFALTVARFGVTLQAAFLLAFLSGLVVISFIDLVHQIIPNAVTLPGIPLGLLAGLLVREPPLLDRLIGALAGAGFLYLVLYYGGVLYGQEAMGEGDLNLIALIGAFLGWRAVMITILVGCVVGSAVGLSLIALGRLERRQHIPFGPFLSLGAGVALFLGDRLMAWYFMLQ
ncbi:MAG: prepilin peptidase [candidate division NC10 bacterium]|nr:prepilin peptidase [candidate division NC10 bacterium]MBI2113637.1 prepilin peptidase [candidate division NC10 bacterium]MBI2457561.1 prepilin peptidase [candidate division NC10 bacterium]